MKQTGLKRASVHAYLPYSKGSYNLSESSLNAERKKNYRNRKSVCERLCQNINLPDVEEYLWDAIVAFADYPFKTETGLPMKYTVKGGENILQPEREKCNTGNSDESVYESTTNSEGRGLCKWLKEAGNVWCKLSVSDLSSDWRVFKEPLTDKPCGLNARSSHGYF